MKAKILFVVVVVVVVLTELMEKRIKGNDFFEILRLEINERERLDKIVVKKTRVLFVRVVCASILINVDVCVLSMMEIKIHRIE